MKQSVQKLTCVGAIVILLSLYGCKKGVPPIGNSPTPPKEKETPTPNTNQELDHLIFEEIFYAGTLSNVKYGGLNPCDHYIKIHNPTKEVKYLDKLGLISGALSANIKYEIPKKDDYISSHVATEIIVQLPGDGKQFGIQPGESTLLAFSAINHRTKMYPYSPDLSSAKIELFTPEQAENELFVEGEVENKNVPNIKVIYAQDFDGDKSFNMANGKGVIALINLPQNIDELKDEKYQWHFLFNSAQGGHGHFAEMSCLKIPNEWVIDAVVLCPNGERKWGVVGDKIDMGSIGVMHMSKDEKTSYAGKAVFRKHDGRNYVDTNNSSVDFEIKEASMIKK